MSQPRKACETGCMAEQDASDNREVEIKVRLTDRAAFAAKLPDAGFHLKTPEASERNTLYDTADGRLRQGRQLLRIRQYAGHWLLTHKAPDESATDSRHKSRVETETEASDGNALAAIFQRLGYEPVFAYEKFRAEWADGTGHIVIDRTPIGDFAELEGAPAWIDATAACLGISQSQYVTASYGQLFQEWKNVMKHSAANMTFAEVETAE